MGFWDGLGDLFGNQPGAPQVPNPPRTRWRNEPGSGFTNLPISTTPVTGVGQNVFRGNLPGLPSIAWDPSKNVSKDTLTGGIEGGAAGRGRTYGDFSSPQSSSTQGTDWKAGLKNIWDYFQESGEGVMSSTGLNAAGLMAAKALVGAIPGVDMGGGAQQRQSYGKEANEAQLAKMNTFGDQIQKQFTDYQKSDIGFNQQLPQKLQGSDQVRALLGIAQGGGPPVNT
jgi:hypothetical protein